MKIYSKFKDYYDIALSQGTQEGIFFERKMEHVDISSSPSRAFTPLENLGIKIYTELKMSATYVVKRKINLVPLMVIFCGKVYPGMKVSHNESLGLNSVVQPDICFYDLESLKSYLDKNEIDFNQIVPERSWRSLIVSDATKKKLTEFFKISGSSKYEYELLTHKVLSAVLTTYKNTEGEYFTINLPLKEVDFFRKFNPWQAYQELSMYIGSVVAPESRPMIKTDDKYKIIGHGFDKMSFRKAPTKVH